ncbi:MAG: MarR family transcriptional regulator, partial [Cyanobacteria bacterium P01_A01_bin.135]
MAQSVFQPLKQRIYAWFAKAQTADTDKDLTALPEHIQTQLDQKLQALPTPDLYKTTIRGAIAEAVETWQNEPDASNVLVVLASPTEAIADILNDSLQAWEDLPAKRITPLPCERRPQDPMALLEQIRAALASQEQLDLDEPPTQDRHNTPDLDNRTTLVVVPCLEQCFLRCIDGWSA